LSFGSLAVVALLVAVIGIVGATAYTLYQSMRPPSGSIATFLKRPRPARKRIAVVLGASTIHGRIGLDALPSVRARLPEWEIVNAGRNGDTCQQMLNRTDQVLACKPDAIVLHSRGNDDALGRPAPHLVALGFDTLIDTFTQTFPGTR